MASQALASGENAPSANIISRFLAWWGAELRACVPAWVTAPRRKKYHSLTVGLVGDEYRLVEQGLSGRVRKDITVAEPLEKQRGFRRLARKFKGRRKRRQRVGLRLREEDCFVRSFELSQEAIPDARQIAGAELERKTPFKLSDVYWDYHVSSTGAAEGKVLVRQFVVKRSTIDAARERLKGFNLNIDFADVYGASFEAPYPVDLLNEARADGKSSIWPGLVKFAGVMCLASFCVAVYLGLQREELALTKLQAEIQKTRKAALAVRKRLNESGDSNKIVVALRQSKVEAVPLVKVWDEVTRVLPDTAWISELRLEPEKIDINGTAKSAAGLVPLLENSPLFSGAKFSSQIISDPQTSLEKFNITFKLDEQRELASASASTRSSQ